MERAEEWRHARSAWLVDSTTSTTHATLTYSRTAESIVELPRLVDAEKICCAAESVHWALAEGPETLTVKVTFSAEVGTTAVAGVVREVLMGSDN